MQNFPCLTIQLPPPIDSTDTKQGPLNVLEVSDPKLCILAHLMSTYEPIEPILESPLSHPIIKQRIAASELLHEVCVLEVCEISFPICELMWKILTFLGTTRK